MCVYIHTCDVYILHITYYILHTTFVIAQPYIKIFQIFTFFESKQQNKWFWHDTVVDKIVVIGEKSSLVRNILNSNASHVSIKVSNPYVSINVSKNGYLRIFLSFGLYLYCMSIRMFWLFFYLCINFNCSILFHSFFFYLLIDSIWKAKFLPIR